MRSYKVSVLSTVLHLLANMASGSYPFTLHTTPLVGSLPASDPESIYLAAVFQLAAPGRFALQTGDWGDNGGVYISCASGGRLMIRKSAIYLTSGPSYTDSTPRLHSRLSRH
jgi:hypothetical protein